MRLFPPPCPIFAPRTLPYAAARSRNTNLHTCFSRLTASCFLTLASGGPRFLVAPRARAKLPRPLTRYVLCFVLPPHLCLCSLRALAVRAVHSVHFINLCALHFLKNCARCVTPRPGSLHFQDVLAWRQRHPCAEEPPLIKFPANQNQNKTKMQPPRMLRCALPLPPRRRRAHKPIRLLGMHRHEVLS